MKNTIIFDLDGTLALVEERRLKSIKPNGKLDWDKFYDPSNIKYDKPNMPVVRMAQLFAEAGYNIYIFSGRSDRTKYTTRSWLTHNKIPFHKLIMRKQKNYTPDEILKERWLDKYADRDDVFLVVDDRQKVVDMWRKNGLTVFQVDKGNF
jgi:phosphoglycolate phosphatase-like HAD superfamily hydrolase|tara:strand:- start:270 stop:719 length:450 start_codon:yes stop_codon:yes gene_type:complete